MTQHVTKMWEIALDETEGMRYSVYVIGRMPLAYYSPEMTGFYNSKVNPPSGWKTIALPEMTGFYNAPPTKHAMLNTIALLEMTGFYNLSDHH